MARFSQESIERVKDAVDIVEVVSAYTELRRSGQRFTGLCPFHDERTPSFSVSAAEKVYHCFGCGVGGDVITFVEEKEGLQFADAVEALADRYGVEVEREQEDPRVEEQRKRRGRLVEVLDRTATFYSRYLWESKEARKAREYLLGRGLSEEVGGAMLRLRKFMFQRVYLGEEARSEHERVQRMLRALFDHYLEHPEEVPEGDPEADAVQGVTDYLAGMTDRFAIATFRRLALPEESRL